MKKISLLITTLMAVFLLASCGENKPSPSPENKFTVTFDSDGGSYVEPRIVDYNTCLSDIPANPVKDDTSEFKFTFDSWHLLKEDGGMEKEAFDFINTPITKDITLKAKYTEIKQRYTITFDSAGGTKVESQTKIYGDKFTKPNDPTKQTEIYDYEFDDWYPVIEGTIQENPISFPVTVTENIAVKAKWKNETRRHYQANTDAGIDHINFTDKDGNPLTDVDVVAGEDFVFKMEAVNPDSQTNTEGYKLPTHLSIFVGDSARELEKKYYKIENDSDVFNEDAPLFEAKVTIDGGKVTGNLRIGGKAVEIDYYEVDVNECYGVDANIDSSKPPYFLTSDIGEVTFSQQGDYDLPEIENILVRFDDNEWVNPTNDNEWCTYDTNTHKLTLKANKAKSNVEIIARSPSPEYTLLNDLDWGAINDISKSGYAPYLFNLGEEKIVMVNDQPHKVRIIGFNEDYTQLPSPGQKPDPNKAIGITFEFKNLISDKDGNSLATQWNDTNNKNTASYNYFNSSIRKALTGDGSGHILWAQKGATAWSTDQLYKDRCVLDMLPDDLVSVLKTPSKYINIYNTSLNRWEEKTIEDKLFLLSPKEMGNTYKPEDEEEHTTTYSYYENIQDDDRVKKQVNNSKLYTEELTISYDPKSGQTYKDTVKNFAGYNAGILSIRGGISWLRSPDIDSFFHSGEYAWRLRENGTLYGYGNFTVYKSAYAIAPAFCI